MEINYQDMLEAGVHFGHQQKRWNPRFKPFLYKHLHNISIIDLERTRECLEKACAFLTEQVKNGSTILFVGTKRQAQDITREVAQSVDMHFCANRWLGGCLTNFDTIKRSLAKYARFRTMEDSGELLKMHKKEAAVIRREMLRMNRSFEGIQSITRPPNVLFVIDIQLEIIAVREAKRLNIPVVAIVDTNSDPTLVDFPIPANDDSVKSLRLLMDSVRAAIEQGLEFRKLHQTAKKDIAVGGTVNPKWTENKADSEEVMQEEAVE